MRMSTTPVRAGVLLALLLCAPLPARAAGDRDKFEKRVGKSASSASSTAHGLTCVCKDGSDNQNRAGLLLEEAVGVPGGDGVFLHCNLPTFDGTTGALSSTQFCEAWELLPK